MSIFVIFLVIMLLIADAVIFFELGYIISMKERLEEYLKKLKEKGWTIESPKEKKGE